MFYTVAFWMLFVTPALTLAQQAPPVAAQPPAKSRAPTAAEPFADDRHTALDAEAQWLDANDGLKSQLAELRPCSDERKQAIHMVRDLAFDAIAHKGNYYKKYYDLLQDHIRLYKKTNADMGVFREELEGLASSAQDSLNDLQRRKAELQESAKASGTSADAALKQLDDLISSTKDRLENLRRSFKQAADADRYSKDSRQVAQSLSDSIMHAQLLLDAESALWDAYYRALEARVDLDCAVKHRDWFRRFETRRP
jgi:small-conductance mechanosensitive channel